MSHEVETMAFANQVPWHGLGNRVDTSVTVDEMLIAAGLDWNVELHPTFARVSVGEDQFKNVRVPNKSAIMRSTDHRVFGVASDNWKPIQPRAVLGFFDEYARAGGATLETAGSLRDGRMIWGLANLGHGFTTNNGRDAVKGYVLMASPNEPGKAASARCTATRVVCANTMAIALAGHQNGVYKQNHLTDFDFDKAREVIGVAHESMHRAELNAKALEALRMSEFDTVRTLAKHFQPEVETDDQIKLVMTDTSKRKQALHEVLMAVEQAPGAVPGNAWGVMNGVTYWADHISGRSQDARLTSAWFGKNDLLKKAVEKDLLALAA